MRCRKGVISVSDFPILVKAEQIIQSCPSCSQGELADSVYVVLSGRLRSVKKVSEKEKQSVGEFGRGDLVGLVSDGLACMVDLVWLALIVQHWEGQWPYLDPDIGHDHVKSTHPSFFRLKC